MPPTHRGVKPGYPVGKEGKLPLRGCGVKPVAGVHGNLTGRLMETGRHLVGRLPFNGSVRLTVGDCEVRLRRRALAILYLLALEGPMTRGDLALMVWGRRSARQNLRVELHHLQQRLRDAGLPPLVKRGDRLALPSGLTLDTGAGSGLPLAGLEGLTPGLDQWIQGQRGGVDRESGNDRLAFSAIPELASRIKPPFLLLVEAGPLFDTGRFARQLARELGLPLLVPGAGDRAGVRLLPGHPGESELVEALSLGRAVWVVPVNALGEEGRHWLRLRAHWPPDRVLYLRPDRVAWSTVKRVFDGPTLERLATLYLESGGEESVLRERLAPGASAGRRIRAAFQAEARHLSRSARLFAEKLSPFPGVFPEEALFALGATDSLLDELERKRWFAYQEGWYFTNEALRRALDRWLLPGRRLRTLRRMKEVFEDLGEALAAAYLGRRLGLPLPDGLLEILPAWVRAVLVGGVGYPSAGLAEYRPGGELLLEPPIYEGDGASEGPPFVSFGPPYRVRRTVYPALEVDAWYCLRGEVFAENLLGVGASGTCLPLAVRVGRETVLAFAGSAPPIRVKGLVLAPLGSFAYAVKVPAGQVLELAVGFERGVVDTRVRAYRGPGAGGGPVAALF